MKQLIEGVIIHNNDNNNNDNNNNDNNNNDNNNNDKKLILSYISETHRILRIIRTYSQHYKHLARSCEGLLKAFQFSFRVQYIFQNNQIEVVSRF